MTYPTLINTLYWTLAAFIVLLAWICVGMGVAIVWLRSRRFAHDRAVRLARIARFREDRPPYDPAAWSEAASVAHALTFGGHGDALVGFVVDARQVEVRKTRQSEPIRLVTA